MRFQIQDNEGRPLTIDELDKEAAVFWSVEGNTRHYVAPAGHPWMLNWFEVIGGNIAMLPKERYEWSKIIGEICGIAVIGEKSFENVLNAINYYKPFIELCLHWQERGYIPVSL